MKRILSVLLSIVMITGTLFILPFSAEAAGVVTGGVTNLRIDDNLNPVWDYSGPAKIDGKDVEEFYIFLQASKTNVFSDDIKYNSLVITDNLADKTIDMTKYLSWLIPTYPDYRYIRYSIGYYCDGAVQENVVTSEVFDLSGVSFYEVVSDLTLDGTTLSWSPVSGADKYTVCVFGCTTNLEKYIVTDKTSFDASEIINRPEMKEETILNFAIVTGDKINGYSKTATILPSTYSPSVIHKYYKTFIGGNVINSSNAADVLGDGKVRFDESTATLYLDNATINSSKTIYDDGALGNYAIYTTQSINIVLTGENTINVADTYDMWGMTAGIMCNSYDFPDTEVNISGNGSLTFNVGQSEYVYGIDIPYLKINDSTVTINTKANTVKYFTPNALICHGDLTLNNARLIVNATGDNNSFALSVNNNLSINNSAAYIRSAESTKAIYVREDLNLNSRYLEAVVKEKDESQPVIVKKHSEEYAPATKVLDTGNHIICATIKDNKIDGLTEGVDYTSEISAESIRFKGIAPFSFDFAVEYNCSHTDFIPSTVEASCTADGGTRYDCKNCDYFYFVKAENALGHTYKTFAEAIEPTCTESGKKVVQKCERCSATIGGEIIPAKGHTSDAGTVTKEATCTETGVKIYKCTVCKTEIKTETIEKTAHKIETVPAVAATCEKAGKTAGKKCSVCGTVTKAQTPVKATGHTEVVLKARAATAKKSGLTAGKKCSVCGKVLVAQKMTLAQVTGLKSSSEKTTSLKLTWSKIDGAKYYKVEQSTDGKTWKTIKTVDTNSYTVSKLTAGKKYQFRVTALDSTKKISGKASAVLKTGTLTSAPAVTLKSSKSKTAVASWKKVTGASKYIVYKSTDGKKWTKVTTTTKLTYTLTKLTGGKKIYVKVVAVNAYGKSSAYSKVASVTVKK